MILVTDITGITEYCQANRRDQDSQIPYFIAIETDGFFELPNDSLIEKGLSALSIPYKRVELINGVSVEITIGEPTGEV